MKQSMLADRRWMREARIKSGYTQETVAKAAETTTANYNRIEMGITMPNVVTGLKICEKLNISPRNFLSESVMRLG